MAERSLKAGFIRDALKYLQLAQEDDPADFAVMLKLGWTYNLLHNDRQAIRWFDLARKSSDPKSPKTPTPLTATCGPSSKLSAPPSGCFPCTPPAGATSSLTLRSRPSCTWISRFIPTSACVSSATRAAPSVPKATAFPRNIYPKAPSFPPSAWPPTFGTA
jgi:hypothetical protein